MKYSTSFALFSSIVACGITACVGTHYPGLNYMDNMCNTTQTVNGDVRIQLSRSVTLYANRKCSVKFQRSTGTALLVKFLTYSMDSLYTGNSGICLTEGIQLYNSLNIALLDTQPDYCRSRRPPLTYFLSSFGKFQFTTGNSILIWTADVELLISEISVKANLPNSTCPWNDFDCGNGYCVSRSLTCNGYDDCGNNADEYCGITITLSSGVIGAIVTVIIFVVIVSVVSSILFRRHRRRVAYTQRF